MKKLTVICIVILVLLTGCTYMNVPEPEQCSLCAGLPCHAPCIINLSTGEMLELAVYEPHPFIAGELAEEQQSETFSFVRGAGVEGYRLSGESITITIPMVADAMEEKHFCNTCGATVVTVNLEWGMSIKKVGISSATAVSYISYCRNRAQLHIKKLQCVVTIPKTSPHIDFPA